MPVRLRRAMVRSYSTTGCLTTGMTNWLLRLGSMPMSSSVSPPEASAPEPADDDAAVVQSLLDDLDEMADGGDDEADDSMSIDPEFVGGVEIEPDNFATASP